MGDRRMISKKVLANDKFTELPDKTKVLYFMMILNADDDGFVSDVKGIMKHYDARMAHLKQLIESDYIIRFESGVVLITHWRVHNFIRADRYKETDWREERSRVFLDDMKCYRMGIDIPTGIPTGDKTQPQVKVSKEKKSKENEDVSLRPLTAPYRSRDPRDHIPLPVEDDCARGVVFLSNVQYEFLRDMLGSQDFQFYVGRLADFIIQKDVRIKSHYETILRWVKEDTEGKNK